jgi:serine/threonine protein kinase, bacterial
MSYCINPECPHPQNPPQVKVCQACGNSLFLHDRYRVGKALGQGGFGATFLALDQTLPGYPKCVIKQLRPTTTSPQVLQMARELFEREARTLGKIGNHPQIPRLLDYFEEQQQFYLVQEYVHGLTLQQEVKRDGPMTEAGVKQFLQELLPLMQYVHSQQVIHRDIKPANIIRRDQDRKLVLIDFGAVKNQVNPTLAATSSEQTALTAYAIGTPGFAPPEQMAMRPVYASDIYALGVTCIYLLTGKSPKDLDYNPATGEMVWRHQVHITNHFAEVLTKMVEVSVKARYQSTEEVLKALDLVPYMDSLAQGLASKPVAPPPQNNPTPSYTLPANTGEHTSGRNSNMASAIRARRAKLEGNNPNTAVTGASSSSNYNSSYTPPSHTFGGVNRHSPPPANPPSNTNKPKETKLDADAVINGYNKGRRDFAQQTMMSLNLAKADLSGAIFHQSKLSRINFQGANLSHCDFGRSNLIQANFRDANLVRAFFGTSDLEGADFRGADLSYAYLLNANVRGVNFCGANLTNAKITDEQLALAKTNWSTILPSGKRGLW